VRILILHSTYLSGAASGENRVVEDESGLLRASGHDVRVWAPTPDVSGALDRFRVGASAVWSTKAARTVESMVRRHGIEIVHAHNLFPTLSPAVLRSAASAGAAVVVTLHNFRLMCLSAELLRDGRVCEVCVGRMPWRGVVHRCYRRSALGSGALASSLALHRTLRTFDAVSRFLAVSPFVRRKHVEAGLPAERIGVKPNFAWPVERRSGAGEFFLFLGRLAPEKGVDTLLRAWAVDPPRLPLVVVGDGPIGPALRRDVPPGVEFKGQVPPQEVPSILARARALLVPSRWYEAAPRSIIEAYAAGVPVIASDIGALPEIVDDGVTGRLVRLDDAEAWARALGGFGDETSERLGAGAFDAWRERYSPERGLAELESAYLDAVAAHRAAG